MFVTLLACTCRSTPAPDTEAVDPHSDTVRETATETADSPAPDTGPFPSAALQADPAMGEPPLRVDFTAEGSTSPTDEISYGWDFGNGLTAGGPEVHTEYVDGGTYTVTLTVHDGAGHTADATLPVYVRDADCPTSAPAQSWGIVSAQQLDEVSGVVQSRQDARVLWVHNDSGDAPQFYALRDDGRLLGTYAIAGAPSGDWEDLAVGQDPDGGHFLYIGDVGDNPGTREFIRVYRVPEPAVDTDPEEPVVTEVTAETLILRYPEGASYNSETLLLDPRNQDLVVVTKDYGGKTRVYTKAAPHGPGDTELTHLLDLDFGAPPLNGGATTGGDISLDGSMVIVRTYAQDGWLWRRGPDESLLDALSGIPCRVILPSEPQPESVAFTTDGAGLLTISERTEQPIHYTALQ